ncbi:MAG: TIGR03619 family F420-dependent LLM class oxidoreductase [Candidatus Methylomirabilales bacterium]
MKLGICLPHYGRPLDVERLLDVVDRAEERGLDSVWVTDHVIVPEEMQIIYRDHMLDPLAVLCWLAGITRRMTLGTSVVILPYRSPIPVAKLLATADVLSGGRLIVGAAIGWLEREFDALGVPMRERGARSDEALKLFQALWTQEVPEVQTRHYRLHGMKASPMPVQKPRPPILVGGMSEGAFRRIAQYADGWMATAASPEVFRHGQDAVQRFWKDAGRDGTPLWTLRIPLLIEGVHEPAADMGLLAGRHMVQGSVPQVIEALKRYWALGCSHVALDVAYTSYPAILETIDILVRDVKPAVAG